MIFTPHPYQDHGIEHIIDNPFSGLFLEMGLGKTVTTLTAIDRLMFDLLEVNKVLVIAPLRVAGEVWTEESKKWDHLRHLTFSRILGSERERKEALRVKADIYVINRENVVWLISHLGGAWPFDMVVIDELSSFKSAKAQRFKALRTVRPKIKRVVGLTGTPAPNGLLDLWPQLYLLDMGERLGKTISSYRDKYFKPGKRNGHIVYEYKLKEEDDLLGKGYWEKEIYDKIGDICISMKAKDWLDLPERIDRTVEIQLPTAIMKQYEEFERKQVLALEDVDHISVVNAAALSNKLLQFASGAVYDMEGIWHEVHRAKIDALEEILDTSNGKPVLVAYTYRHDAERIRKYLKKYKPVDIKELPNTDRWNRREIPLLLAHPASAGHGLNMQAGGNILVWFGPTWSLELYQQLNGRLDRQGQTEAVIAHHILAKGTMDEAAMASLGSKEDTQEALMQAVKAIYNKHKTALRA